jgi:thiol-disulfide isomerase/thioredoxin
VTTRGSIGGLRPQRFGPPARAAVVGRGAALACAVLLVALFAAPAGSAAEKFKPFKLKTLDGTQTSFADVLGRATLVVFFFPTCTYCNAVLPEIQRLNDTYKEHGLSTVWINVLPQQERLIPEWRAKRGYTVPVLLGGRSIQRDYDLIMTGVVETRRVQGRRREGPRAADSRSARVVSGLRRQDA